MCRGTVSSHQARGIPGQARLANQGMPEGCQHTVTYICNMNISHMSTAHQTAFVVLLTYRGAVPFWQGAL